MLFQRMSTALRSLDYEGTLVYLLDNHLETLHLAHRVDGGQVQERLVSLSGPVRAVTRSHGQVTCTMRDGHPISVKSHSGRWLLRTQPIDPAALAGRYRVELQGSARVAGRETDVVSIGPLDALRYGYRFHLDRETGLPLKSDLIDVDGNPIEQLLFTSVTLDEPKASSAPLPDRPEAAADAAPLPATATAWRFDSRPAGFEQTMHDAMQDPSGAPVEHFVFSDRLSSYSVYIELDAEDGLQGVTRVGAAHAAGRRVGGYQITAVGEVPAATVEAAVEGVSAAPEAVQ
jgi:sigma-E factor negative regulatory protein RseB